MKKQGFRIDPHQTFSIEDKGEYDDKRIDDLYYKYNGDLIPIVYIYPIESEKAVLEALDKLKQAKKAFDDIQAEVFYRVLPKLR